MQTETMCWDGANSWTDAMNTFKELHNHLTANTQCYTMWNMILDADYNYVSWMNRSQNSMITVTPATQKVKYNHEFYVVKHWSHYIRIGAARVHVLNTNTANLRALAFKNPDGTIILELQNYSNATVSPVIKIGSQMFTPALLPSSVNTFNLGGTENTENWSGAPNQISPYLRIEAESYNSGSAELQSETCTDVGGGQNVGYIVNNGFLAFDNLNFKNSTVACSLRVANSGTAGSVEVRLDSINGTMIGTTAVPGTGGWQTWTTITCTTTPVSGVHSVYLVFKTPNTHACNINWVVFKPDAVASLPGTASSSAIFPSIRNTPGTTIIQLANEGDYRVTVTGINGKKIMSLSGNSGRKASSGSNTNPGGYSVRAGIYSLLGGLFWGTGTLLMLFSVTRLGLSMAVSASLAAANVLVVVVVSLFVFGENSSLNSMRILCGIIAILIGSVLVTTA